MPMQGWRRQYEYQRRGKKVLRKKVPYFSTICNKKIFNIYNHLNQALPIAGVDGTLKKRMKGGFASGNVRAKTGTVTGISSLAGYCKSSNGHTLCFSIINQGLIHGRNGRAFQDRVCTVLCSPN